ncbi:hypothetical protein PBRA_003956 [Plasmodiophora brassicae]|uniref:UDENN domain-containing protein n=1 Tax=Plasmodiophora brassicae TaxID=37360 RepID=A0A0G4IJD7_PLABS|nr:hypothetical protein PBRA_003956 [Plasmodiophora brassicae]
MLKPLVIGTDHNASGSEDGDEDDVAADGTATAGPERLLQYFISVGIGDSFTSLASVCDLDSMRPITSLCVCGNGQPFNSFELVKCTVRGQSASLRSGFFGAPVWLGYSRDPSLGEPLTEIVILREDICPPGFTKLDYQFSLTKTFGRGPNSYIFYERDPIKVPLVDVLLVAESDGESPPPDFWRVQNDAQTGIKLGNGLELYYKKGPATPLDQVYKPCVIDRYPRKDDPFSPLPVAVAQFCQPNGTTLMRTAPLPTTHDFVLTNAMGRKMYGSALTCYEPLSTSVWQRSLESILERFPRMTSTTVAPEDHSNVIRTLPPKSVTADCQSPEHRTRLLSLSFESKPIYSSRTLCLLSYYPFFDNFNAILSELYRISVSPLQLPIETHLCNLFEIPLPLTPRLASEIQIGSKLVSFNVPNCDEDFPLTNWSFEMSFRCLSVDAVLTILNALILERKVILLSSHARLLTPVAQTLLSLMFPLEWQYSYVPVLPRVVSVILDAPMPVFVGIQKAYADPRLYDRPDVVVVNLDLGTVFVHPLNPLVPFPPIQQAVLKGELEKFGHTDALHKFTADELANVDLTFPVPIGGGQRGSFSMSHRRFEPRAVRAAFVHFFAAVFGTFRNHLLFPEVPSNIQLDELFDKSAFLAEKQKGPARAFSKALLDTQCFTRFIEERTFPSDRDSELKFFDHCCDYHRSVEARVDKNESLAGLVQSLLQYPTVKAAYRVPPPPPPAETWKAPSASYTCFPIMDPALLYEPRPIAVEYMCNWKSADQDMLRTEFQEAFFLSRPTTPALFQHRASLEKLTKTFESNEEWARHLLMLVYSSWFLLEAHLCDWNPNVTSSVVDGAFRVLNQARSLNLSPDETTYRSVLKLCAKFSQAESARTILQLMKDSGIQPSQVTYALFTSAVTEAPISPQTRLSVDDFHSKSGPGGNRKDQPLPPRSSSVDMRPRSKKQVDDVIIWKDVRMSTKSTCPGCNSRLCDSEIMSGWTDDPTSQTTRCIVCRTTSFTPTLSIVLTFVKKEPQTESISFPYVSPLVLRNMLDSIIAAQPKDVTTIQKFRKSHSTVFYNLLWYFFHEKLPLNNLVGVEAVDVKPLYPNRRRESLFTQQERDPEHNERFGDRNRNVMNALTRYIRRGDILNAMRLFLLHRIRESNIGGSGVLDKSTVWSHSMFREMDALGAQWFFPSREEWIRAYTEALGSVPRHMVSYMLPMDNAPSTVVSVFDDVFKHIESGDSPVAEAASVDHASSVEAGTISEEKGSDSAL